GQYELNSLRFSIHQMEDWVQLSSRENVKADADRFAELLQDFRRELKFAVSFKRSLGDNIVKLLQGVTFSREEFKSLIESFESEDYQTAKKLILDKTLVPTTKIVDNWKNDIRNIADKNGKKIDFQIDIPESLKISESLAHMMNVELGHIYRNCVDHGIELPEKRKELGKPENGRIAIRISKDNGILSLIISDDGAGLDEDKIIDIALSNHALDQKLVNEYITTNEIWRILFIKGFSSKKTISNISGRGVGLDAVEVALKSIDGSIRMSSEKDKGSTFTIEVPLSPN
ncbi:hypothetical protein KKA14_09550, partial [bacterium]|nr:hypothetical protein [bacterium]